MHAKAWNIHMRGATKRVMSEPVSLRARRFLFNPS
jgi:hypothetical protein